MTKQHINHWLLLAKAISLTSTFLIILGLVTTGCQPVETEPNISELTQSAPLSGQFPIAPTTTPSSSVHVSQQTAEEYNSTEGEYGYIDIYRTILQRYDEVLNDPTLPQETRAALLTEQSIMAAEATSWALPVPTLDPAIDWVATGESLLATEEARDFLTRTPAPTIATQMGMRYGELAESDPRSPARTNSAWRGYVQGIEIKASVGRFGRSPETGYAGHVSIYDFSVGTLFGYTYSVGFGITETLKLQAVIEDRYLVMEVFDYAEVTQPNSVGTGEMYYFDMVAREFMVQPTAELWIENFPSGGGNTLQAVATPTPPIAVTISPINPTIHWNTDHTEECWASGAWAIPAESFPRGEGQEFISEQVISTYYLTCFNPVVHTTAFTAPSTGSPALISTFTANNQTPLFTTPNTPLTLQWGSAYGSGQTCQASGAWTGNQPRNGSANIASLPVGKHLFVLTCQGETLSVLVVVEEAPAPPSPTATPTLLPTATPTLTPSPTSTPTATAAPPLAIKINFQPSGAVVPVGYVVDSGQVYGPRGNGLTYGWDIDITATARDRNNALSADQQHDTLVHLQLWPGPYPTKWELELPNGQYQVRLVAGDPVYINSSYRISAEGLPIINGNPTLENRWFDNTITVTVSDGKLTLTSGAGANNNKINFIEIQAVAP